MHRLSLILDFFRPQILHRIQGHTRNKSCRRHRLRFAGHLAAAGAVEKKAGGSCLLGLEAKPGGIWRLCGFSPFCRPLSAGSGRLAVEPATPGRHGPLPSSLSCTLPDRPVSLLKWLGSRSVQKSGRAFIGGEEERKNRQGIDQFLGRGMRRNWNSADILIVLEERVGRRETPTVDVPG